MSYYYTHPLASDVASARAEHLAGPVELAVSPSVLGVLQREDIVSIFSVLAYAGAESKYKWITWPNHPSVEKCYSSSMADGNPLH